MEWSNEQRNAIDLRDRELLVSAAAGSGKTTVLVERIVKWVTEKASDGSGPEDLDHFLVVTFTRAAAAEMRTRLYKRLMKEAENTPEDDRERARHIRRQLTLISQAHVQTIDSFASFVLKNYFHLTDLDPSFRIGDEGELELMRQDVLADLLEERYKDKDPAFRKCMEYYTASKKADDDVQSLVLQLYDFAQSTVDPDEWLSKLADPYRVATEEELDQAPWNRKFYEFVRTLLLDLLPDLDQITALLKAPDLEGAKKYEENKSLQGRVEKADAEKKMIRRAAGSQSYREFFDRVRSLGQLGDYGYDKPKFFAQSFTRSRFDELKRYVDRVSGIGNRLKKMFRYPVERVLQDIQTALPAAEGLADLTMRFGRKFREEKARHGLIDFSDAEHIALNVLWKDGKPSEAAEDLRRSFREILIDEYQDSNDLQEALLGAVAKTGEHGRNIFMVGDKKQSIYMFRHAKPELFEDKFNRFLPAEKEPSGDGQTIELNANYRSRREVTDIVNTWFTRIMHKSIGAIEYDDREKLIPKGEFKEEEAPPRRTAEFLLADLGAKGKGAGASGQDEDADSDEEGRKDGGETEPMEAVEAEAHMIAGRIRALIDSGFPIQVKGPDDEKMYRPARYQDIVILVRSRSGQILENFSETMTKYGIPCHAEARTGFYSTQEVRFVMNLLRVLNDPIDDPALAAVMKHPLFGFQNEDLAQITVAAGRGEKEDKTWKFANGFFGRVRKCLAVKGEADPLGKKIKDFLAKIEYFRKRSSEMPLSSFLRLVYRETGLISFMTAMGGGKRRLANLEQLIERARTFEQTSYAGLFNFIRFIEKKEKTETEEGEANTETEKDDVVRIMTMHGSKGLEFPIVFLPKMQRKLLEKSKAIQMHSVFGIGIPAINLITREKSHTYYEQVVQFLADTEARGEELRILYVAMTRAKEKLYLTAAVHGAEEQKNAYKEQFLAGAPSLSTAAVWAAPDMLTWLLQATDEDSEVNLQVLSLSEIQAGRTYETDRQDCSKEALLRAYSEPVSQAAKSMVDRIISTDYLRDDLYKIPASLTVSRLKAMAAEEAEDPDEEHRTQIKYVADDKKPERITGSARGTLYHFVMEQMNPHKDARSEVARLTEAGLTSTLEQSTIKSAEVDAFWASSVGERFVKAFDQGRGFRERQFILALPVREIPELYANDPHVDPEETVMVQGVIDLYFEEEDGLVLVDYKTDAVNDPAELVRRYAAQIRYYKKALTALTGKPVKESYLWSFRMRKAIPV